MKNLSFVLLLLLAVSQVGLSGYAQGVASVPVKKYDYVVSPDGTGDFTSIQAAIEACKSFPDEPIRIFIKKGVYHEKVFIPEWNPKIVLIGEARDSTIIDYDDYFNKINKGPNSTFYTPTVLVQGNDFYAENITFKNSAGAVGQAIALGMPTDVCLYIVGSSEIKMLYMLPVSTTGNIFAIVKLKAQPILYSDRLQPFSIAV